MSTVSSVSFPVTRPAGQALVVGSSQCRASAVEALGRLGFGCTEVDDPYAGIAELCRNPRTFRALILSLQGLFPEELELIPVVKRRFAQVEVWLSDIDGRQTAVAEAMRLGADGLISDTGLHRIGVPTPAPEPLPAPAAARGMTVMGGLAAGLSAAAAERRSDPDADRGGAGPRSPTRSAPKRLTAGRPAAGRGGPAASDPDDALMGEAVLTADELRALLQEEPATPPPSPH